MKNILYSGLPALETNTVCGGCGLDRKTIPFFIKHVPFVVNGRLATFGALQITCPRCSCNFYEATYLETNLGNPNISITPPVVESFSAASQITM